MLERLRNAAASWVAKIFIGLLVLSFAVWGIADIFGNYGNDWVLKVGETEVSANTFQNAYRREINLTANQIGRQPTPDEARAIGIDRRVINELSVSATLVNQARQLGLGISDDFIASEISESPEFRNSFGRFDRSRFNQILSSNGLTEEGFVQQARERSIRNQISATVAGALAVPDVLTAALNQFQNAKRVVEYFEVPPVDTATLPAPTAEDLSKFYDTNKPRFTDPEFRKLGILTLSPSDLTDSIEVTEDQIAGEYENRRADYETPERRAIDQMAFPANAGEKAAEAHAKIAGGADFLEVAAEYGFKPNDVDLGLIDRSGFIDETIAEAAFSLDAGEISTPIEGLLGTSILRVREIKPGETRPLDAVRDEIRTRIALDLARDEAIDLHETVEDERAGGLSLAEVGNKLGLTYREFDRVDRGGRGPAGATLGGLPENAEMLRTAFASDVGLETDPIDLPDGGFLWVEVKDVIPPALNPYDDVKTEVERLWREDRLAAALREKAQALISRGREGVTIAGLADEVGQPLLTSEPFERGSASAPFDNGLVQAIFAAPEGGFVRGHAREGDDIVVARVKHIVPAEPLSEDQAGPVRERIEIALKADLFEQYINGLQTRYRRELNENTLAALTGAPVQ